MGLWDKARGLLGGDRTAQAWLRQVSGRALVCSDHGTLSFPDGRLSAGDASDGRGKLLRDGPAGTAEARVLTATDRSHPNDAGANSLLWLEVSGTRPVATGRRLGFGTDVATLALTDGYGADAFRAFSARLRETGPGDSFDWLEPQITATSNFAKWTGIPGTDARLFLFTTRADGGYEAVWLLDKDGGLSGILIDIMGRTGDLKYLDKLLPAATPA
ncbi:hypothetical protein [Jannaschia marina]|uniref:hypothetical protein n=1 Tax=Jannaschia marina TaxID=2741674 RepID=UPI0015CA79AC|nr:hypothetical protein [Jannaschia marina]